MRSPLALLPGGVDKSGTIASAGAAQTLAAQNSARSALLFQNISDTDIWLSETGTATASTAGSFKVAAGSFYEVRTNRAISIICTSSGKAFTAVEVG